MIYFRNFFSGTIIPHPRTWLPILQPAGEKCAKWFSANWPVLLAGVQGGFGVKELKWDRARCIPSEEGLHRLHSFFRSRLSKTAYFRDHAKIVIVASALGMTGEYYHSAPLLKLSRSVSVVGNIFALMFHRELLHETDKPVRDWALIGLIGNIPSIAGDCLWLAGRDQGFARFLITLGTLIQMAKLLFERSEKVWDRV